MHPLQNHLDGVTAMTAQIHRLCDHWTPEQKRKAEQALEQHRAHEENQIMNEALVGIPCAGYVGTMTTEQADRP